MSEGPGAGQYRTGRHHTRPQCLCCPAFLIKHKSWALVLTHAWTHSPVVPAGWQGLVTPRLALRNSVCVVQALTLVPVIQGRKG